MKGARRLLAPAVKGTGEGKFVQLRNVKFLTTVLEKKPHLVGCRRRKKGRGEISGGNER